MQDRILNIRVLASLGTEKYYFRIISAMHSDKRYAKMTEPCKNPRSQRIGTRTWDLLRHAQSPKPETPKSLQKVSREEFGTPRPRTPKRRKRGPNSLEKLFKTCEGVYYPEGPERHLDTARQKLTRDNFCRSIAAQLPSPWGQF